MISVALWSVALICLFLGFWVITSSRSQSLVRWIFCLITLCLAGWALSVNWFFSADSARLVQAAAQIFYMLATFFVVLIYWFFSLYPSEQIQRLSRLKLRLSGIAAIVMAVAIIIDPNFIVMNVTDVGHGSPSVQVNHGGYLIFVVYFVITFISSLYVGYRNSMVAKQALLRNQLRFYTLGITLTSIPGFIANMILPFYNIYDYIWIGPLCSLIFVAFIGYAIAKHGLFDIKTTAVRATAYILTLVVLGGIYYLLGFIVTTLLFRSNATDWAEFSSVSVALALILALLFQPIKTFFDTATNKIFFRGRYDVDEFLGRLNTIFAKTTDLHELINKSITEICITMKSPYVMSAIFQDKDQNIIVDSTGRTMIHIAEGVLIALHRYIGNSNSRGGILVADEVLRETYSHTAVGKMLQQLVDKGVSLIVPIGGDLGVLLLGESLAGGYTKRDIMTLETVSGELSIAIQNALSIEEIQVLNRTLKNRVDTATRELRATNKQLMALDETKDEFISMASHQLRTPLTSIKGYISMVLEGDAGEITSQQRALLSESFASSERMVHLIGDFLNVSRLQTGKFMIDASPTNLADVIAEEVESLQRMAKDRDIVMHFRKPKVFPLLNLDENKLRQVIMNFIDNAIYYSPTGSTIDIKLTRRAGEVRFEVKDQGMGVPKDVQHRLFTKFFRADNARKQRPDGTGIGLYLAKKVITEQGGKIIFSSQPGKGSTFGFRLPIAPLRIK